MSDLINSRRGPESSSSAGDGINTGDNRNQTTSDLSGKKDTDGSKAQKDFEAILAHFLSSHANNNNNRAQAPVSKFSSRPQSKFALNEENKGDGDLSSGQDVSVAGSRNQSQSLYESFLSEVFDNQGAQSNEKTAISPVTDQSEKLSNETEELGGEKRFKQVMLMLRAFMEIIQTFTGKQSMDEFTRDAEQLIREYEQLQPRPPVAELPGDGDEIAQPPVDELAPEGPQPRDNSPPYVVTTPPLGKVGEQPAAEPQPVDELAPEGPQPIDNSPPYVVTTPPSDKVGELPSVKLPPVELPPATELPPVAELPPVELPRVEDPPPTELPPTDSSVLDDRLSNTPVDYIPKDDSAPIFHRDNSVTYRGPLASEPIHFDSFEKLAKFEQAEIMKKMGEYDKPFGPNPDNLEIPGYGQRWIRDYRNGPINGKYPWVRMDGPLIPDYTQYQYMRDGESIRGRDMGAFIRPGTPELDPDQTAKLYIELRPAHVERVAKQHYERAAHEFDLNQTHLYKSGVMITPEISSNYGQSENNMRAAIKAARMVESIPTSATGKLLFKTLENEEVKIDVISYVPGLPALSAGFHFDKASRTLQVPAIFFNSDRSDGRYILENALWEACSTGTEEQQLDAKIAKRFNSFPKYETNNYPRFMMSVASLQEQLINPPAKAPAEILRTDGEIYTVSNAWSNNYAALPSDELKRVALLSGPLEARRMQKDFPDMFQRIDEMAKDPAQLALAFRAVSTYRTVTPVEYVPQDSHAPIFHLDHSVTYRGPLASEPIRFENFAELVNYESTAIDLKLKDYDLKVPELPPLTQADTLWARTYNPDGSYMGWRHIAPGEDTSFVEESGIGTADLDPDQFQLLQAKEGEQRRQTLQEREYDRAALELQLNREYRSTGNVNVVQPSLTTDVKKNIENVYAATTLVKSLEQISAGESGRELFKALDVTSETLKVTPCDSSNLPQGQAAVFDPDSETVKIDSSLLRGASSAVLGSTEGATTEGALEKALWKGQLDKTDGNPTQLLRIQFKAHLADMEKLGLHQPNKGFAQNVSDARKCFQQVLDMGMYLQRFINNNPELAGRFTVTSGVINEGRGAGLDYKKTVLANAVAVAEFYTGRAEHTFIVITDAQTGKKVFCDPWRGKNITYNIEDITTLPWIENKLNGTSLDASGDGHN